MSSLFAANFLTFERIDIDPIFRSKGVAIADYNSDDKPDILISNKRGVMLFIQK